MAGKEDSSLHHCDCPRMVLPALRHPVPPPLDAHTQCQLHLSSSMRKVRFMPKGHSYYITQG